MFYCGRNFACFDSSAKGFFGPIGVLSEYRGKRVGQSLLLKTLYAMKEYGYGYAIIGWVSDAELFYRKTVGAECLFQYDFNVLNKRNSQFAKRKGCLIEKENDY